MKLIRGLLVSSLLAVVLSGLASEARAQRSYALGIMGGAAMPTGKFSEAYSTDLAAMGFISIGAAELPIGMRLDGIYNRFSGRTVTPAGGGASVVNPNLRLAGVVGNLVLTASGTAAKPYLVVGAGFYSSKADSPDAKSRNDIGYSLGLGSTFRFGPLTSAVETKFHSISRDPAHGGSIHFAPIMLGVVF